MVGRDRGSWEEYERLVLRELERLDREQAAMRTQLWAAVGTLVVVLVGIIIKLALGG